MHGKNLSRLAALLLAAFVAAGCGAPPVPQATATPAAPGGQPAPGYPAPAAAPTQGGYPAPAVTPYPAPAQTPQGGASPPAGGVALMALQSASAGAPVASASVVATYPHDPGAYTQGLVYIGDDWFYEGTGYWQDSSLRKVALASGQFQLQVRLLDVAPPASPNDAIPFGEGIAVVGDQIFQLTWQSKFGLVYDRDTFDVLKRFSYPPAGRALPVEGWGLTYDGARLIMSDGTANLYFIDPAETFRTGVLAVTGQVEVRDAVGPVPQLNELEFIEGEVFANIYRTELIARIDPATGRVNSYVDLSGLKALLPVTPNVLPDVLNGIAYDAAGDRLFVTGKWWPSLFEIDLPAARLYLPLAMVSPPPAVAPMIWS